MKSSGILERTASFARPLIPALALCLVSVGLAACSKVDSDDKPARPASTNEQEKAGVTIDAETQERIGLKTAAPLAAQWQPQIHAVGNVVDPLAFMTAVTDLASARAAAEMSRAELDRTQKLADQNNVSTRALEAARAAAAHDTLALNAARASFTANWGVTLAAQTNLVDYAQNLCDKNGVLVKLSLPVGLILTRFPATAQVSLLDQETNSITANFRDDLGIDPASQVQTLLFSVDQDLPRSAAITGSMAAAGEPVSGVLVPFSAVLRHQGLGWVYVQTDTNQFVRTEIPLDRIQPQGWFVAENLSATNQIVITGAQTVLSTELGVSVGGDQD